MKKSSIMLGFALALITTNNATAGRVKTVQFGIDAVRSKDIEHIHLYDTGTKEAAEKQMLPSQEILSQRLESAEFKEFDQKTKIAEQLGDKSKSAMDVFCDVHTAIIIYGKDLEYPDVYHEMNLRSIILAIIADYPQAARDYITYNRIQL